MSTRRPDLGLKDFPQFAENYQTYQTILTFIRNRDRAALQQLVMNYRLNGTEIHHQDHPKELSGEQERLPLYLL